MKVTELLNLCLAKNIPFVSYRLPGSKETVTWVQLSGNFNYYESINEVDKRSGFVYAPFHRKTNFPVVFFEPELIFSNNEFNDSLIKEISNKPPLYPDYSSDTPIEVSKKEYLGQAKAFINSFHKEFPKAVLSRVYLKNKSKGFNAGNYFLELLRSYPDAFCHIINIPGSGSWAGASPETLLRIEGKSARTVSLAGTKAFQPDDYVIIWSEKEKEEQNIVTDYIESIFQKFEIYKFNKEKKQNFRAGSAIHLLTKFKFNKSIIDKVVGKFISELHPTPAVCGFPKDDALDLILKTEIHNREYYSGFLGPINYEYRTDLFVNLRCMKILPDKLALYVGGGLTAKSDPENEWKETVLKAKTLLSIM